MSTPRKERTDDRTYTQHEVDRLWQRFLRATARRPGRAATDRWFTWLGRQTVQAFTL